MIFNHVLRNIVMQHLRISMEENAQDTFGYVHKIALFLTNQNLHAEINDSLTSTLDQWFHLDVTKQSSRFIYIFFYHFTPC